MVELHSQIPDGICKQKPHRQSGEFWGPTIIPFFFSITQQAEVFVWREVSSICCVWTRVEFVLIFDNVVLAQAFTSPRGLYEAASESDLYFIHASSSLLLCNIPTVNANEGTCLSSVIPGEKIIFSIYTLHRFLKMTTREDYNCDPLQ